MAYDSRERKKENERMKGTSGWRELHSYVSAEATKINYCFPMCHTDFDSVAHRCMGNCCPLVNFIMKSFLFFDTFNSITVISQPMYELNEMQLKTAFFQSLHSKIDYLVLLCVKTVQYF